MYEVYSHGIKIGDNCRINEVTFGKTVVGKITFVADGKSFEYISTTPVGTFVFPTELELELYNDYTKDGIQRRTLNKCKLSDISILKKPIYENDNNWYVNGTITGDLTFAFREVQ